MSKTLARALHTLAAIALAASTAAAATVDYPARPITLVIPTGAGGGTDLVARVMQKKLADALGQPVVIDNKAGAGGIIGNQFVAKSPPDGYTLLMSSNQFTIISATNSSTPYDPRKDFVPITSIGVIPTLVVVNPHVPATTIEELVAYAKANPRALQYASAGNGSPNNLFGAMFNTMAGVSILHVPYKGIAPALADVVGGNVSMAYASLPTVQGFLASGQLRPLAVTSGRRIAALPNLPSLAEIAPGYDADIWLGLWGVANTPAPIVAKVHEAVVKALADAEVRKRLGELGLVVETSTPAQFGATVNADLAKWTKVVNESNGEIGKQ